MVITLTDCGTKKGTADNTKMYFPVVPEKINYSTATYFEEYTILNKGPAKIPSGNDIVTIGWECFFPGTKLQKTKLPFINNAKITKGSSSKKKTASEMHKQLESWRSNGKKLTLTITGTPFSFAVYIDKYNVTYQDAYGSIYYEIEFSKAIEVSVTTVKAKKTTTTNKTSGTTRSSKTTTTKKHTVKKGDCLWNIAKKYYKKGSEWKKIYNANKTTIENAAKKHGKKSSNNGNLIYPGTVLKIP